MVLNLEPQATTWVESKKEQPGRPQSGVDRSPTNIGTFVWGPDYSAPVLAWWADICDADTSEPGWVLFEDGPGGQERHAKNVTHWLKVHAPMALGG